MLIEQLYERARLDHAILRGETITSREVGITDGQGLAIHVFSRPLPVTIDDVGLASGDFLEGEDGSLALFYPASSATALHDQQFGFFHVVWVDGPVYNPDGSVEKPEWLRTPKRQS